MGISPHYAGLDDGLILADGMWRKKKSGKLTFGHHFSVEFLTRKMFYKFYEQRPKNGSAHYGAAD